MTARSPGPGTPVFDDEGVVHAATPNAPVKCELAEVKGPVPAHVKHTEAGEDELVRPDGLAVNS